MNILARLHISVASLAAVAVTVLAPAAHSQTAAYRVVHAFTGGSDGFGPGGTTLARDPDGNLYGTTSGSGTVFKLTPAGVLTTLYDFSKIGGGGADADGEQPVAGMVRGTDGNFYGTTQGGGANNAGTVFKITPAGALTTLHSFATAANDGSNADGVRSQSPLIQGKDGNFYGTAEDGGVNGNGTIFKITPAGVLTLLHTFSATTSDTNYDNSDGATPTAGLVQGTDGNFYGAASRAGAYGFGTLFKVTPAGVFTTLYDFNSPDDSVNTGGAPIGTLVQGRDGSFYGTAEQGGNFNSTPIHIGSGTIFKITPDGVFTLLHRFDAYQGSRYINREGGYPVGGLILGGDGNFYGVCNRGGTNGTGTVFQMTPAGAYQVLHTFGGVSGGSNNTDGAMPLAGLTQGAVGHYYGTASRGGKNDDGTVYEVTYTPIITSALTASVTVGQSFSYQITARNGATSYATSALPSGLNVNGQTGVISGTPTKAGTYKITIKAANAYGIGTALLTLTVKALAPSITSADSATATVGKTFSYQITATGNPTSYGAVGLKPGLSLNKTTGLISGTPTGAPGTFDITLKAANSGGVGEQTLALTIKPN